MKKILILSYYFPPMAMGGTRRIAGFAKYLPDFGWQPTVVTVKPVAYYAHDKDLLDEVAHTKIERTGSLDPLRLMAKWHHSRHCESRLSLLKYIWNRETKQSPARVQGTAPVSAFQKLLLKALNFLLVPDNKILWLPFAYHRAKTLLRASHFDAILSSGPPHSSHLIARRLAKKFHLPWIADFRDTWANGDFQAKPTFLHTKLDLYLQKKIVQDASQITAVSAGLTQMLQASVRRVKDDFHVIANGYEEADFRVHEKPQDDCFDVVHVGAIGNFARPGMAIHAFRLFVEDALLSPRQAKLHFVGADIRGELNQFIANENLQEYIITTGYVPHREAVKYLLKADALLFLVSGKPTSGFIPGKTFEYIAARKPVLAISEHVEGLQLLRKTGLTRHARPDDLPGAVNALKAIFLEFKKHSPPKPSDFDDQQFTRRNSTRKLAGVLDRIHTSHQHTK